MTLSDKQELGQCLVDTESNQITFTDLRFYKAPNGEFLPSVTTILDAFPKPAHFYTWLKENGKDADVIRDEAGRKGSKVHKLIEDYNEGIEVNLVGPDGVIRNSSQEWGMLEKYVQFVNRFQPKIIRSEFNLVKPEFGTAGTIDSVMEIEGKRYIIDFKTSNNISDTYFMQLAAYKKMYENEYPDEQIDGVGVLWLNAKTRSDGKKGDIQGKGWQMIFPPKDIEYYYKLFTYTQALWNEVNGDSKPNNLTYTLSHKRQEAVLA